MSKQDIEKRLGFAAQGVKSDFGSNDPYMQERTVKTRKGKTTDLVAEIGQNGGGGDYIATLMLVHSNGEPQVLQSKYGYKTPESATRAAIRLFDAHVSRGGYARSGAKAKFADAALNQIRNNAAISDKIRTLVSKGLSVPQAIDSVLGEGTYKRIGSEVYDELRKDKSSRPGAKASFEKEYVLWGLPKGETDRLHEKVLSTQAKTPAQMEDVKKRAAAAGWHSFRVQILDLSKPYKGFARPGVKAKMSASFIVAEAIFNAENAVRRGDTENARRWIKAAQDAMDETVVSTGMRSKLEQLVKRYKMSRPGVKAKMDRRDGNYFVIRGFADDEIVGEKSLDNKQEGDYYGQKMLEYIKKSNPKAKKVIVNIYQVINNGDDKVVKTLSFRVGAKASFGRAEKVLSDGSVSLDFTEANEWLSTVSDEALKYIISDSNAAAKAMGSGGKKFNYYTDLALTAAQMLRSTKRGGHRLNSSRPSVKAKA